MQKSPDTAQGRGRSTAARHTGDTAEGCPADVMAGVRGLRDRSLIGDIARRTFIAHHH